ncbi:MAG: substrate-binding domain-containing protein, partial [Spirochaetales bacterium]|nr:substrate-binding domain-containing protein [Spirochaetales bacterium]
MKISSKCFIITVIIAFFSLTGCSREETAVIPELLIYCGETMAAPMQGIADIFEEQENCKIIFLLDGSQNLLEIIEVNKVGDLFLPGSSSYLDTADSWGYVSDIALVGQNIPSLIVLKDNPKGIAHSLESLLDPELKIVLGSAESGS